MLIIWEKVFLWVIRFEFFLSKLSVIFMFLQEILKMYIWMYLVLINLIMQPSLQLSCELCTVLNVYVSIWFVFEKGDKYVV